MQLLSTSLTQKENRVFKNVRQSLTGQSKEHAFGCGSKLHVVPSPLTERLGFIWTQSLQFGFHSFLYIVFKLYMKYRYYIVCVIMYMSRCF